MPDTIAKLKWAPSPFTTWIEVSGPSHVRFLQGLCSNDVEKLAPGQGCEAFFPTVQGKVIAHCLLMKFEDRVLMSGLGDQATDLLPHLQKYALIEDVEVIDHPQNATKLFVWGNGVSDMLADWLEGKTIENPLDHATCRPGNDIIRVVRTPLLPVESLDVYGIDDSQLVQLLEKFGAVPGSADEIESLRVQNRFPRHGVDIGVDNLAQEVNREAQAISFKKGCYLGQETVARIDALGHVNKKLVPIRLEEQGGLGELPMAIKAEGKEIGRITSLGEADGQRFGLAMIRRGHNSPGTKFESELGTIIVEG